MASNVCRYSTASTSSNDVSSRSHTVFTLTVSRDGLEGRVGALVTALVLRSKRQRMTHPGVHVTNLTPPRE
jgi:hypothetical protein